MDLVLATAPTLYPISRDDLKMHLRIETDTIDDYTEDDLLDSIIYAGVSQVESHTRRRLLTQTWDMYLDKFPSADYIKIPFGNLASVTHVKYTDSNATQTTMTVTTEYLVETNGDQCGRIVLPYGEAWPSFTAYTTHPIVVRFVCGWTTAALVPYPIKMALRMICADMYVNRESQIVTLNSSQYSKNVTVDALLSNYRLWDEF